MVSWLPYLHLALALGFNSKHDFILDFKWSRSRSVAHFLVAAVPLHLFVWSSKVLNLMAHMIYHRFICLQ